MTVGPAHEIDRADDVLGAGVPPPRPSHEPRRVRADPDLLPGVRDQAPGEGTLAGVQGANGAMGPVQRLGLAVSEMTHVPI